MSKRWTSKLNLSVERIKLCPQATDYHILDPPEAHICFPFWLKIIRNLIYNFLRSTPKIWFLKALNFKVGSNFKLWLQSHICGYVLLSVLDARILHRVLVLLLVLHSQWTTRVVTEAFTVWTLYFEFLLTLIASTLIPRQPLVIHY